MRRAGSRAGCRLGTGDDGARVATVACSACHTLLGPRENAAGERQLVLLPFVPNQPTGGSAGSGLLEQFREAWSQEQLDGVPADAPAGARALYALAKEAQKRSEAPKCVDWHCDAAAQDRIAGAASKQHAIDLGYMAALSIFGLSANLGKMPPDHPGFARTDSAIDIATETKQLSDFDVGGSHQGITDAVALPDPLTNKGRPARFPGVAGTDNVSNTSSDFASSYTNAFKSVKAQTKKDATQAYLEGATYLRMPGLNEGSIKPDSLAFAGFTNHNDLVAALPRYATKNITELAKQYFHDEYTVKFRVGKVTLPVEALCRWTVEPAGVSALPNLIDALQIHNQACGACHRQVNYEVDPRSDTGAGGIFLSDPTAPMRTIAGTNVSNSVLSAIIASNGTANLPSIMANAVYGGTGNGPAEILTETSSSTKKVGAFMNYRTVFAGAPSISTFLAAGGAYPNDEWVVPGVPSCSSSEPLAIGSDREAIAALYGLPEQTRRIQHPWVAEIAGLTAQQKSLLATFLASMKDGAVNLDNVKKNIREWGTDPIDDGVAANQ